MTDYYTIKLQLQKNTTINSQMNSMSWLCYRTFHGPLVNQFDLLLHYLQIFKKFKIAFLLKKKKKIVQGEIIPW